MARHTAFEVLYRDYYPRVFGLCRRLLGSGELAEDATQETFMRAYKAFGKFDTEQPFWQWIAAIANNHCIDVLRKRGRGDALFHNKEGEETQMDELESLQQPALSELLADEDARTLHEAITALPDKYRVPVVLAYFQDTSYADIANTLDISTSHVGVLLLRARDRLKKQLSASTSADSGRE